MANKKSSAKGIKNRSYTIHKKLEQPVNNLLGYGVLLLLSLVTFTLIYFLKVTL